MITVCQCLVLGLMTGTLIGMVGVGGVLLAPLLVWFLGMDMHLAMATCSWSFLFTGITGTVSYARKKSVSWQMVGWLAIGIVPGAMLGAKTNSVLSETALTVILALLIAFSGINTFFKQADSDNPRTTVNYLLLILIGLGLGFGSALTGTGGPVLLIPFLFLMRVPVLTAIGVSQVIQLPIAVSATFGFYRHGNINFSLGTFLGVVQALGVILGAYIAHSISTTALRRIVAVALIGVACFMLIFKVK